VPYRIRANRRRQARFVLRNHASELEDFLESKHSIRERVGRAGDESTDHLGDLEKDGIAGRAERMARHVWARSSELTDVATAEGSGEVTQNQDHVTTGAPGENRAKRRLRGGAP
jgi:hypothetical protein